MSGLTNNFKGKVNLVLVQRKISQKELIFECSCSRSHFNKVINGERKASPALQKRMINALRLTNEEAEFYFNYDNAVLNNTFHNTSENAVSLAFKNICYGIRAPKNTVFVLLLVSVFILYMSFSIGTVSQPVPLKPKLKNDWSSFIKDVSIPDGTTLKTNNEYVKTWRLKNSGEHEWKGRYLKRLTPHSDLLCSSASMVPIKNTKPGETVDISIKFRTPHIPGSCRLDFKMTDKFGQLYFPQLHGVYLLVNVSA